MTETKNEGHAHAATLICFICGADVAVLQTMGDTGAPEMYEMTADEEVTVLGYMDQAKSETLKVCAACPMRGDVASCLDCTMDPYTGDEPPTVRGS